MCKFLYNLWQAWRCKFAMKTDKFDSWFIVQIMTKTVYKQIRLMIPMKCNDCWVYLVVRSWDHEITWLMVEMVFLIIWCLLLTKKKLNLAWDYAILQHPQPLLLNIYVCNICFKYYLLTGIHTWYSLLYLLRSLIKFKRIH